ncbi:MAG TPA: hypothetical protein VD886_24105, partial [Herpetosiphonaceae bacterium]|nr:hypothetical protein [Herpetosiphonaceae bacterium]
TRYAPNGYYVKRGQSFPYIITLTNNSPQALVVDKVWVFLPGQNGANFTYIVGTSKVNGTTQAPNTVLNGLGGRLEWLNIPVAANGQTTIRYSLNVQGLDYYQYCNDADGYMAKEQIRRVSYILCVKINPQVELTKAASKTKAGPGEEVVFDISLTNRESVPYMLALVDQLDEFEWVGHISGYGTPSYDPLFRRITWPLVSVAPNQTISAKFRVRMMDGENCRPGNKPNETWFANETNIVVQDPPVKVFVELTCRKILFSQAAERSPVSLEDKFTYTFQVSNIDSTAATSTVAVTDVLPLGFTWVGVDPTSQTVFTPTQSVDGSGRTQLNWTLPAIPPSGSKVMKFIVRSGKSIGPYENWMSAAAQGGINSCVGQCEVRTYKNVASTYSLSSVQVQPLITVEPSLTPTTCVLPGTTVNYKATVLNTNVHSYPRTTLMLTLPLGLQYVSPVGSSPAPAASITPEGATILSWGINVPKKPDNAFGAQVVVEVALKVGNMWGNINTELDATSTSGLVPRKDGVVDATVKICPQSPSLAKIIAHKVPKIGDEVTYQLTLANPTASQVTVTVEDVLPSNVSFVKMLAGNTPTQNGNKLSWNLSLPAGTQQAASVTILRFTAKVNSGVPFQKYTNTATVTQGSTSFVTSVNGTPINTATFAIGKPVYLPMVRR